MAAVFFYLYNRTLLKNVTIPSKIGIDPKHQFGFEDNRRDGKRSKSQVYGTAD